jgi:hypothetical protein
MKTLDVTDPNRKKPEPGEAETIQSAVTLPDYSGTLKNIGGSKSNDWNRTIIDQALGTLWHSNSDEKERGRQVNATVAFLGQQKPADELEAMMAAQLFAAHNAAMECYRRAMIKEQSLEARTQNLTQANKLSRTYATLIEALSRHRGKSTQQKVTVEHVHVYEGGQAVVGVVNPAVAGGGVTTRNGDQPHGSNGTGAIAPQPALLRADAPGNVLPIPGHAERAPGRQKATSTRSNTVASRLKPSPVVARYQRLCE